MVWKLGFRAFGRMTSACPCKPCVTRSYMRAGLFLRLALALGCLALPPLPREELFLGSRVSSNPVWEFPKKGPSFQKLPYDNMGSRGL